MNLPIERNAGEGTSIAVPSDLALTLPSATVTRAEACVMRRSLIALIFLGVAAASATPSFATSFAVTTLATKATDPDLINPWGLAASATSPLWIG